MYRFRGPDFFRLYFLLSETSGHQKRVESLALSAVFLIFDEITHVSHEHRDLTRLYSHELCRGEQVELDHSSHRVSEHCNTETGVAAL